MIDTSYSAVYPYSIDLTMIRVKPEMTKGLMPLVSPFDKIFYHFKH